VSLVRYVEVRDEALAFKLQSEVACVRANVCLCLSLSLSVCVCACDTPRLHASALSPSLPPSFPPSLPPSIQPSLSPSLPPSLPPAQKEVTTPMLPR
jgi:hypothetical protein